MAHQAVNLSDQINGIDKFWSPQQVTSINGSHSLKVASIHGEFLWHSHPETDELFYCVSGGPFRLELCTTASDPAEAEKLGADSVVHLNVGDVFKVPRGMQHRPVADVPTGIMMLEKLGTVNTGDREGDERTVYVEERK